MILIYTQDRILKTEGQTMFVHTLQVMMHRIEPVTRSVFSNLSHDYAVTEASDNHLM